MKLKKPKYKIGDKVKYRCNYKNEIVVGEIAGIREAKYSWDYSVRYQIYIDLIYVEWIKEKDIISKVIYKK